MKRSKRVVCVCESRVLDLSYPWDCREDNIQKKEERFITFVKVSSPAEDWVCYQIQVAKDRCFVCSTHRSSVSISLRPTFADRISPWAKWLPHTSNRCHSFACGRTYVAKWPCFSSYLDQSISVFLRYYEQCRNGYAHAVVRDCPRRTDSLRSQWLSILARRSPFVSGLIRVCRELKSFSWNDDHDCHDCLIYIYICLFNDDCSGLPRVYVQWKGGCVRVVARCGGDALPWSGESFVSYDIMLVSHYTLSCGAYNKQVGLM